MSQDNPYAAPLATAGTPGYGPATGHAMPYGEYEFSEPENGLIGNLAAAMRFVGIFLIVLGALGTLGTIMQLLQIGARALPALASSVALALQGLWTLNAATSFRDVVQTEGSDISNLMTACGALRRSFVVVAITAVISLAGVGLTLALGPVPTAATIHASAPSAPSE